MKNLSVGENIRRQRKKKGLTQKKLAEITKLNEVTIRSYEAGKYKPKIEALQKIADALEVSTDSLMNWNKEEENKRRVFYKAIEKLNSEDKEGNGDNYLNLFESILDTKKQLLISHYDNLNDIGKDKAIEQLELLAKIPEYKKENIQ